jgi:hypothetical protein
MAKELPYFQFEPAEYLTKDISFCSLSAQGLFINICCYYWQRNCRLTKEQVLKRLNFENELDELICEGVIDFDGENILIKFLDEQLEKACKFSKLQSDRGKKGGRPKTRNKPEINPNETQSKAIREDKIIEDEIKESNINKKENSLVLKNEILENKIWSETQMKTHELSKEKFEGLFEKFWSENYEGHILTNTPKQQNEIKRHFSNWTKKQKTDGKPKQSRLEKFASASGQQSN